MPLPKFQELTLSDLKSPQCDLFLAEEAQKCTHSVTAWAKQAAFDGMQLLQWKAAALSADLNHLLQSKPRSNFGNEDLVPALASHHSFTKAVVEAIKTLQFKADRLKGGSGSGLRHGPWMGGAMQSCGQHASPDAQPQDLVIASMNVRGALGCHGGHKARIRRIAAIVAQLKDAQVGIAILSEPRMAPGASWPKDAPYSFHGMRSMLPNTVGVLVSHSIEAQVSIIEGLGSERHCFLSVRSETGPPSLVVAVYGYHKLVLGSKRLLFWNDLSQQLLSLTDQDTYKLSPIILAGDTNIHFPGLCPGNAPYAGRVEQQVHTLLCHTLGLAIGNPTGMPTLDAGTGMDIIAAKGVDIQVSIQQPSDRTVPSDHMHIFGQVQLRLKAYITKQPVTAEWKRNAEWHHAIEPLSAAFMFVACWAAVVSRSVPIRRSIENDRKGGMRQQVLDLVAWWRNCLMVMAGHVGALVFIKLPCRSETAHARQPVTQWLDPQPGLSPLEIKVQEEVSLANTFLDRNRAQVQRHAELWYQNQGEADKLLGRILKPQGNISFVLHNADGTDASVEQAADLVADHLLNRAQGSEPGDEEFTLIVQQEVQKVRTQHRATASSSSSDLIAPQAFYSALARLKTSSTSLFLPRRAVKSSSHAAFWASWAVSNLVATFMVRPKYWLDEVRPLRKEGHGPVQDTKVVRPITCRDNLESAMDTVWLEDVKSEIEAYMTMQQTGGRYDHVLVVLSIVLTLQARLVQMLPTLLEVGDLERGYESTWRDALRLLLHFANVEGWHWLYMDVALGPTKMRVKVGSCFSRLVTLVHTSIAQGKTNGTHLFGVFTRALTSACTQSGSGVAVVAPAQARLSMFSTRLPDMESSVQQQSHSMSKAAWLSQQTGDHAGEWASLMAPLSFQQRIILLEGLPGPKLPYQQFVDDAFVPAAAFSQLSAANKAISQACHFWKHKFAGGKKRPRFIFVSPSPEEGEAVHPLCDEQPQQVEFAKVLNVLIDDKLSFRPQLEQVTGTMISEGCKLATSMSSAGFGLPSIASQFHVRVMARILSGSEVLASCSLGFSAVANGLNYAQYIVAKSFLGCQKATHLGNAVAVLAECRLLTRAGSTVAKHIVMSRARLACLPAEHPAVIAAEQISQHGISHTWMQDSQAITKDLVGAAYDLWLTRQIPPEVKTCSAQRKRFLQNFCRTVVKPRLWELEHQWFQQQLGSLNTDGLIPYSQLVPLRCVWTPHERWAQWPPSLWAMHRIWVLARIISGTPILSLATQQFVTRFPWCPLCGHNSAVGLMHVVCTCVGTADLRQGASLLTEAEAYSFLQNILDARITSEAEVTTRILLVGGAVSRLAQSFGLVTA